MAAPNMYNILGREIVSLFTGVAISIYYSKGKNLCVISGSW
jgi:hypothetical protein